MKKIAVFTFLVITSAAQGFGLYSIPGFTAIAQVCSASWNYLSPTQQKIAVGVTACGAIYAAWPISEQSARVKADQFYDQRKTQVQKDCEQKVPVEKITTKYNMQRFQFGHLFNRKEFQVYVWGGVYPLPLNSIFTTKNAEIKPAVVLLRWSDGKKNEEHFDHTKNIWIKITSHLD